MKCIHLKDGGVLTVGGPEYVIDVNGKDLRFEMHGYCGPVLLDRNGYPKNIGPKHPFWRAIELWSRQGMKIENGRAVYGPPPTSKFVKIGPRTLVCEATAREMKLTGEIVEVPDY